MKMSSPYYCLTTKQVLQQLNSQPEGLSNPEAADRLEKYGVNELSVEKMPSWLMIFILQFKSPLIYILLCAMVISLLIQEWSDSIFIAGVLLLNALIGTIQEHGAEKTAQGLKKIMPQRARVLRGGESYELKAEHLVPGDIILLEAGVKVPADCRLYNSHSLEIDESLLTGESLPIKKESKSTVTEETPLSDRINMVYSGTLVTRGKSMGIVTVTGQNSELGKIAQSKGKTKPPLILRMEEFTRRIAYAMGIVVLFMLLMAFMRGMPLLDMFYLAVALAVAAIPEGLPIALTIALAIGMRKMAQRNVIVRKLVAVESLGSCTYIGSDKTGTLTVNELTVKRIVTPSGQIYDVEGQGIEPVGKVQAIQAEHPFEDNLLQSMAKTSVLTNEAFLAKRNQHWTAHGDSVDIAFLVLARKLGIKQIELQQENHEIATIPYESEKAYSATCCQNQNHTVIHVKGAPERLLELCGSMRVGDEILPIKKQQLLQQLQQLALEGYRILAICQKEVDNPDTSDLEASLSNLVFLGFVGIIDPLRKEVPEAIKNCKKAGLKVAMITGDHPITAFAIGKNLSLVQSQDQVVTGQDLKQAKQQGQEAFDECTAKSSVYARVSPQQKMDIIESVNRQGHFVAVTGDGVNDVPALRTAHVGVSMGKRGTDVARESSSIIVTDDNFASIVAGIEEGRIAYANVRKVIYFLVATGVAEVLLFIFSLLAGLPMPLLPVQLLWLNLVTQGVQDVALAFEESEGYELSKSPRSPKEPIFNKLMIRRVLLASFSMSVIAFAVYYYLLIMNTPIEQARNLTLLLMVLFENIQALNCRSETQTLLKRGLLGNKFLLVGVIAAQVIHFAAMYMPGLSHVLDMQPVSLHQWLILCLLASSIFFIVEAQKFWYKRHDRVGVFCS